MNIWVKCMYVYGVWMCVRVFWSAQALHGETNALYWKCIKRQNSTHLTLLKHQSIKTSLYKVPKNHWVITLLKILGSVRRKLQSTVSLDHPVARKRNLSCSWFRQKRLFSRFSIQPPFCSTFHDGSFWRSISGLHIVLKVQNRGQPSITYLCSRLYCLSVKALAIIDLPWSPFGKCF